MRSIHVKGTPKEANAVIIDKGSAILVCHGSILHE